MTAPDPVLHDLATRYGIATEFWDWKGRHTPVEAETIVACLAALGVDASTPELAAAACEAHEHRIWQRSLPPCVVVEQNQERYVDVHVAAGANAHVWVRTEDGRGISCDQVDNFDPDREVEGVWRGRATFRLPTWVDPGYHTIVLETGEDRFESPYIVSPAWVGIPARGVAKTWGFMTQLYSVSGRDSWCFGDLQDLTELATWSATRHHAGYVLVNPLHAAQPVAKMEPSPYLPASRRFINPIYIRPEAIEEYARISERQRRKIRDIRAGLVKRLAAEETIQRDAVWAAKKKALRVVFRGGRTPAREMQLRAYVQAEGRGLRDYATWCALCEAYGPEWPTWEPCYQRPDSPEVAAFAADHADDVEFYQWLQWIAELQAAHAHRTARDAGMPIGVVSDLAVGVSPEGSEAWANQSLFAQGVVVGAPPDAYNQSGQIWSQPPWRPDRLRELAYAPYRAMVRSALRHSGGLRVDHIIGLFRLWWVPDGMAPTQGTYVRYDHEALIGILALEAVRAGATLIGEDLGTVEPWVRDYLARRGILGTSVLWFECWDDGAPKAPENWREYCLAGVTTHDLPPTLGYLAHDHVSLRHRLGLLTEPLEVEIARDVSDQADMMAALEARGLLEPGDRDPRTVLKALHRYLNLSPSRIRQAALTDAVGERRTENQPGTTDEYPNWRIPLGDSDGHRLTMEDIFELASVGELTDIMNAGV